MEPVPPANLASSHVLHAAPHRFAFHASQDTSTQITFVQALAQLAPTLTPLSMTVSIARRSAMYAVRIHFAKSVKPIILSTSFHRLSTNVCPHAHRLFTRNL
jgi:hypothetical protein